MSYVQKLMDGEDDVVIETNIAHGLVICYSECSQIGKAIGFDVPKHHIGLKYNQITNPDIYINEINSEDLGCECEYIIENDAYTEDVIVTSLQNGSYVDLPENTFLILCLQDQSLMKYRSTKDMIKELKSLSVVRKNLPKDFDWEGRLCKVVEIVSHYK